jgi:hypothetical protein
LIISRRFFEIPSNGKSIGHEKSCKAKVITKLTSMSLVLYYVIINYIGLCSRDIFFIIVRFDSILESFHIIMYSHWCSTLCCPDDNTWSMQYISWCVDIRICCWRLISHKLDISLIGGPKYNWHYYSLLCVCSI